MKQKIVLFIITIAMLVSCMAVAAYAGDSDDHPGDIIDNPWGDLFTETYVPATLPEWESGSRVPTESTTESEQKTTQVSTTKSEQKTTQVSTTVPEPIPAIQLPNKVTIKKIYKKKLSSKIIKIKVKKDKLAESYKVAVFKTKKNAKALVKAIQVKDFKKVKITLKSKSFKNKKKLFIRVCALNKAGAGDWSAIKKVKIKK